MITFFITFLLLLLFSFNLYTNYYHYKFFLLYNYLNLGLSYYIFDISNIFYALFFLYIASSSCYYSSFMRPKHFCHPSNGINYNFSTEVFKTYLTLIASGIFFLVVGHGGATTFILPMKILLAINIFLTLIPAKYTYFKTETMSGTEHKSPICGFNANISTNATLLSLMAPFAMINFSENIYVNSTLLFMCLIAIIKTTATVGLVAYISSLVVFIFFYFGFSPLVFISTASITLVSIMLAVFFIAKFKPNARLFSISGRDNIFRFTKKWITPRMNKYFGTGVGSFTYIFPATHAQMEGQGLNQFRIGNYIWLHNDVLQFYIEGGIVGILLALLAYFYSVYHCIVHANYAGLCFLISYAINSLGNFPNHLVPDIVVSIIMFCFIANF